MKTIFILFDSLSKKYLPPYSNFIKGFKVLKIEAKPFLSSQHGHGNMLFDLENDQRQEKLITDTVKSFMKE